MRAKEDETMATAADVEWKPPYCAECHADLEVQVSVDVTFIEAELAE